ncbi:MAG: DUF3417 domain-containing protein, partial [Bacteroidetes bacterium]|nr:DUF3417 domain-containing protein [Bacteroidota bacterium]
MNTLSKLKAISRNLWWSWNPDALDLFRRLNPGAVDATKNNPLKALDQPDRAVLESAAFASQVDSVFDRFESYLQDDSGFDQDRSVAYFCMEYGLHESMPFYSGGLGVLAGDTLKAASDMKLPVAGIGLAYRRGSFKQALDRDGNQHEEQPSIDFTTLPMKPVVDVDGTRIIVYVRFPGRAVAVQAWRVDVGAVPLYLLDTDHPNNSHLDQEITSVL